MREDIVAALAGAFSLTMILGALGFQYIGQVLPCEMCMWQRWPQDAAIFAGLGAALLYHVKVINLKTVKVLAWLALLFIVASGLIGGYQALVEWKLVPGPSSCTGQRFVLTGNLNLNEKIVPCDVVQWKLFGISLAGYNFLCSLGFSALAALLLSRILVIPAKWLPRWAQG